MKRLGINTVHLDMEEIEALGLNRVEFVLARGRDYPSMLEEILQGIETAEQRGLSFSLHLPLFLFDWYEEDYLSAFYLDPDLDKRLMAYRFLEANLERLEGCQADYCIIHFPGVYKFSQDPDEFDQRLTEALQRLDAMAGRYGIKLLLEYFGSNFMFWEIDRWVEKIRGYANLGILCDTGHLYFSSLMHGFDFYEGLKALGAAADAFHIWTTRGRQVYSESESYRRYHHIVVHAGQREAEGFAFDGEKTMDIIRSFDRPIIIEATDRYRGRDYFIEGIRSIVDGFR